MRLLLISILLTLWPTNLSAHPIKTKKVGESIEFYVNKGSGLEKVASFDATVGNLNVNRIVNLAGSGAVELTHGLTAKGTVKIENASDPTGLFLKAASSDGTLEYSSVVEEGFELNPSLTWCCAGTPSGIATSLIYWRKIGDRVDLVLSTHLTAADTVESVVAILPANMPDPQVTYFDYVSWPGTYFHPQWIGSGRIVIESEIASQMSENYCDLKVNSANVWRVEVKRPASVSARSVLCHVTYFTSE